MGVAINVLFVKNRYFFNRPNCWKRHLTNTLELERYDDDDDDDSSETKNSPV